MAKVSKDALIAKGVSGLTIGVTAVGAHMGFSYIPVPTPGTILATAAPFAPAVVAIGGMALLDSGKKSIWSDVGAGLVAAGFINLAHNFGIGGNNSFVNGYGESSEYMNERRSVNGDYINGFIQDDAVQDPNMAV